MMNIFTYLKNDHKKVAALFEEMNQHTRAKTMQATFNKIKEELTLHADPEKNTFYVALKKFNDKKDAEHGEKEHNEIKAGIKKIDKLDAGSVEWIIAVGELKQIVTHHVKEEETKMFPLAKSRFPKELTKQLVIDMEAKKKKLRSKFKATSFTEVIANLIGLTEKRKLTPQKKVSSKRKTMSRAR